MIKVGGGVSHLKSYVLIMCILNYAIRRIIQKRQA